VHFDEVASGRFRAVADGDVLNDEVVGGGIGQGHFGLAHDDNPTGSTRFGNEPEQSCWTAQAPRVQSSTSISPEW